MSNNLVVTESQQSAVDSFKSATFSKTDGIVYAKYYFQNATTQTLSNGNHFTIDPATCTASGGATACSLNSDANHSGLWLGTDTSGNCTSSIWYDDSAHGKVQVGGEDGSRCYIEKLVYDISNIPSNVTISKVELTFGAVDVSNCNGSGGASGYGACPLIDITYLQNDYGDCGTTTQAIQQMGSLTPLSNTPDATLVISAGNPEDTWESSTIELNHNSSYITTLMEQDIATGVGNARDEACFFFSQAGSDVPGSSGSDHNFFAFPFPTLIVTYSSSILFTITPVDFDGHVITKGNLRLRTSTLNGTVAYRDCLTSCKVQVDPSTQVEFAMQWDKTTNANGYVKIDIGANSSLVNTHNDTSSSNKAITIYTTIYNNIQVRFYDDNGELHSPTSVTYLYTGNSSEKTHSTFSSKGVADFRYIAKGNSSSFTIKDVDMFAKNVVTNGSVTVTPTAKLTGSKP